MARIVELKAHENVTLGRGVMQNWVDLDQPGPSASPVVASLLENISGRVIVIGPHDIALLTQLADRADELVVVVRTAPDAETITEALPGIDVRAGNLGDLVAAGETFDVVVALDDLSRVLSAESEDFSWEQLAEQVILCAAPQGQVYLAIENERGLHRQLSQIDSYARDWDRDWTPFRTWDASRPRTTAQLMSWADGVAAVRGEAVSFWSLLPAWSKVEVLGGSTTSSRTSRDLMAFFALRGGASPLPLRSAALADLMEDVAAGWVVVFGGTPAADVRTGRGNAAVQTWSVMDERAMIDGVDSDHVAVAEFAVPSFGRSLLLDLIEAAADSDTPTMRRLLRAWYDEILAHTHDGKVEAAFADAHLGNVILDAGGAPVFVGCAAHAKPLEDVVWSALADLLGTIAAHGLKHPWATAMNRQTRLASLGAMAGAKAPADLQRWVAQVRDQGQSREELLAVVKRQQDELKSVWSRWKWDEKQYAAYVAKANVKKSVKYAKRHGKNLPKTAAKRAITTAKKKLK